MTKLITHYLLVIAFILSGCAMRVVPREVERVDQELKGNRGIVRGASSGIKDTTKRRTKTVYDVEVELGSSVEAGQRDRTMRGNKGYIHKREISEEKSRPDAGEERSQREGRFRKGRRLRQEEPIGSSQTIVFPEVPNIVFQESKEPEKKYIEEKGTGSFKKVKKLEKSYVVKKGDTLQKISKAMYGTTKKWKKIYEANKDVLKNPDKIKPGQKLVIPVD